jgi:hypothetical protein
VSEIGAARPPRGAGTTSAVGLGRRLRSRSIGDYLDVRLHLAALSIVAGFIHAAVAAPHFGELWLFGSFFVALALFQLGWGIAVYERPSASVYRLGLRASVAVIAVWVASRTVGLPLGPEAGSAETIGPLDPIASAIEVAIALLCAALLRRGRPLPAPVAVIRPVVLTLMGLGLLALLLGGAHHY